jgi:hypothetical protein
VAGTETDRQAAKGGGRWISLLLSGAGHTLRRPTTGERIGRRCRRPTPRSASIDTNSDERRNSVDYHEIEDEHDDRLRHGEAHLEHRGEWQDGFFFEGVRRDVEQRRDGSIANADASPVDGVAG